MLIVAAEMGRLSRGRTLLGRYAGKDRRRFLRQPRRKLYLDTV